MGNFSERLRRFMYGRYGTDEFNRFLIIASAVFALAGYIVSYFQSIVSSVLGGIALLLILYSFYRMLSRRIVYRQRERNFYLSVRRAMTDFCVLQVNRFRDRKTHVYRRCPSCRAVLRFPRVKGKHGAVCPRCSSHFEVRIHFAGKTEK